MATDIDIKRLATAIRTVEVLRALREGYAYHGPEPLWFVGYAEDIVNEYAKQENPERVTPPPSDD